MDNIDIDDFDYEKEILLMLEAQGDDAYTTDEKLRKKELLERFNNNLTAIGQLGVYTEEDLQGVYNFLLMQTLIAEQYLSSWGKDYNKVFIEDFKYVWNTYVTEDEDVALERLQELREEDDHYVIGDRDLHDGRRVYVIENLKTGGFAELYALKEEKEGEDVE